ncbi:hypothetical protein N0V82_003906 [Gnomoniopsis sp. IMI 355080]|nr:hypothetical protein N0V82_003906 [Gnomoniopsis sp. IMI 355080]
MEHFTRTDWLDLGEGEDGIIWERDPVKHRDIRKKLSPAFSVLSLNAKEPTLHKHIGYFIAKMKEIGQRGVELREVQVVNRIERRGTTTHLNYFDQICPPDAPEPDKKQLKHMEIVAGQLLTAGYEPISSQFLCTLIFLAQDKESYRCLVKEIRDEFKTDHEINTETVAHLKVLNACLTETLRMTVIGANGLPRISPGAVVDGHFVAKGIEVQYGHFAFTRDTRYFHDPDKFRPQRWLPADHPLWNAAFKSDAREAFWPFSRGPRSCPGMGSAWRQTRVFIAKVIWNFNVERLAGEEMVFERDFRSYAMWDKPTYRVRLSAVSREEK